MTHRSLFSAICFLASNGLGIAQFTPPASPILKPGAGSIRALVIGISDYQAPEIPGLPNARRDAENIAAFLRSGQGRRLSGAELVLLADAQATTAGVSTALDALLGESRAGDRLIVYFSGYAQRLEEKGKAETMYLQFYDSPKAPVQAGSLALSKVQKLLENAARDKGIRYLLALEFRDLAFGSNPPAAYDWEGTEKKRFSWAERFSAQPPVAPPDSIDTNTRPISYTNHLLSALIGLADDDEDKKIKARELFRYLERVPWTAESANKRFYLAISNKEEIIGAIDEQSLATLKKHPESMFSPLIHLEAQPLEDYFLQEADEKSRALYQDFVLMIQLGNLITPPGRCAEALLDSLLNRDLSPSVKKHLTRRLAAALQDETQQALNAYLQVNSREINRRRRNSDAYKLYPAYLSKSIELLGDKHMMHHILLAKLYYFEGLVLRMEGVRDKDSLKLVQAGEKQQAALREESAGAFIYNELGVVQSYLHRTEAAQKNYTLAIEYSPTWSIPYVNIALTALENGDLETAYRYAFIAIPLAPWNAGAYNTMGMICARQGRLDEAEKMYLRALRADPELSVARYNLACLYAIKGFSDVALDWLRQAFEADFDDVKFLSDPDLVSLRPQKGYRQLVEEFFPGLGH